LDGDEMRQWYRYLDWFLDLPPDANRRVYDQAGTFPKEQAMWEGRPPFSTFISYPEQVALDMAKARAENEGHAKGQIEGRLEGLEALLEAKFQAPGLALMPDLRKIEDPERLATILQTVRTATTIDDVRKLLLT